MIEHRNTDRSLAELVNAAFEAAAKDVIRRAREREVCAQFQNECFQFPARFTPVTLSEPIRWITRPKCSVTRSRLKRTRPAGCLGTTASGSPSSNPRQHTATVRDNAPIGRRWPASESRRITRCRLRSLQILETGPLARYTPATAAHSLDGKSRSFRVGETTRRWVFMIWVSSRFREASRLRYWVDVRRRKKLVVDRCGGRTRFHSQ